MHCLKDKIDYVKQAIKRGKKLEGKIGIEMEGISLKDNVWYFQVSIQNMNHIATRLSSISNTLGECSLCA